MILWNDIQMGKAFGRKYYFLDASDSLPTHRHGPDEEHNVIVLNGTVRIEYENGKYELLPAGRVHEFDSSKIHTIIGLVPGTKTLHVYLNGRPSWYDGLPTSGSFPPTAEADRPKLEG